VLAAPSKEGLITLEQVMQDGTKIKALASSKSYRQEETIREHPERAQRRVAEMGERSPERGEPSESQASPSPCGASNKGDCRVRWKSYRSGRRARAEKKPRKRE